MAEISWQGELKGLMYRHSIQNKDIAEKIGCSNEWVAKMFTGKRTPHDAEERLRKAVDDIIRERRFENADG